MRTIRTLVRPRRIGAKEESEIIIYLCFSTEIELRLFQQREHRHKYFVEHQEDKFLVLTDGGGKYLSFKLVSCPVVNLRHHELLEIDPYELMSADSGSDGKE